LPQAAFRDLVPGQSVQPLNRSWQRGEGGLRQEHVVRSCFPVIQLVYILVSIAL